MVEISTAFDGLTIAIGCVVVGSLWLGWVEGGAIIKAAGVGVDDSVEDGEGRGIPGAVGGLECE